MERMMSKTKRNIKPEDHIEINRLLRKIRRGSFHKSKVINPKTTYNRKDKSWKKQLDEE